MRRLLLTALMTLAWLLASPSLQLRDAEWLEVGAPPATAEEFRGIMVEDSARANKAKKPTTKKSAKKPAQEPRVGSSGLVSRRGSPGIVRSNQPGFHPMQPITPPQAPNVTGTVRTAPSVTGFPTVPTVPIVPRGSTAGAGIESSQDRVARCTHQGALGGLPGSQQGAYIHNCAF
jgi:hypothetical protein